MASGNGVCFCFLEGDICPRCSLGMGIAQHPAHARLPGKGQRERDVDVTHGWLRSSQNTSATSVRAAAPNSTQQRCSNFTPQVRMAAQAGGKSPGEGEERGKEQAGGRKAPDLSKFQPPVATLASLLKHFHLQRNQPIQSSKERSSPGPPGWSCSPTGPAKGSCQTPVAGTSHQPS